MADEHTALANFFAASAMLPWGESLTGTALSLPDSYKDIMLKGVLYIEYLQTGSSNDNQGKAPNKNHVVFQIPFSDEGFQVGDPDTEDSILLKGVRISMDLTQEHDVIDMIDKDRVSGLSTKGIDFAKFMILGPCSSRLHTSVWRWERTTTPAPFTSS